MQKSVTTPAGGAGGHAGGGAEAATGGASIADGAERALSTGAARVELPVGSKESDGAALEARDVGLLWQAALASSATTRLDPERQRPARCTGRA